MAEVGGSIHATWPDVALWVLQHDGLAWALVAAVVLIGTWKAEGILNACTHAADRWHLRRMDRRQEQIDSGLAETRLEADIEAAKMRLRLPRGGRPGSDDGGG